MTIAVTRMHPNYEIHETGYDYTKKQVQYIDAIEHYKMFKKSVPTIREIANMMEVKSPATVMYMLERLEKKGYNYKEL